MADEDSSKKMISYNGLRDWLQAGHELLMRFIPEGSEPVLSLEFLRNHSEPTGEFVKTGQVENLDLLGDFAKIAAALLVGRTPEEVLTIMRDGAAQLILIGEEGVLSQQFLD